LRATSDRCHRKIVSDVTIGGDLTQPSPGLSSATHVELPPVIIDQPQAPPTQLASQDPVLFL
jgi:hypothetical protein